MNSRHLFTNNNIKAPSINPLRLGGHYQLPQYSYSIARLAVDRQDCMISYSELQLTWEQCNKLLSTETTRPEVLYFVHKHECPK